MMRYRLFTVGPPPTRGVLYNVRCNWSDPSGYTNHLCNNLRKLGGYGYGTLVTHLKDRRYPQDISAPLLTFSSAFPIL